MKKILNTKKGFTLIEMMVSVSIFVIVATVASGAFVTMSEAQRKAQSIKLVVDNVNFSLDGMIIPMRMGSNYNTICSAKGVSFTDSNDITVSYVISEGVLYKGESIDCDGSGGNPIISQEEVTIKQGQSGFVVGSGAGIQPWVQIKLRGTAQSSAGIITDFDVQTFVSQRNL